MVFYTGKELNQAICKMLGIDPSNVYRVILDCKVGEAAKVTVYEYATTDEGKLHQFADIIKHYEIREVSELNVQSS